MSFCWLKTPIERNQQSNHFAWNSQPRLTWPMANLFKLFGDSIGKISREQTFISGSRTAKWVGPVSRHPTWEIPPDVGHPISVCRRGWFVLRSESNFVGLGIAGEEPNGLRWKKVNVSWVVVFGEGKNGQICGMNRKQPKKKAFGYGWVFCVQRFSCSLIWFVFVSSLEGWWCDCLILDYFVRWYSQSNGLKPPARIDVCVLKWQDSHFNVCIWSYT